MKKALIVSLVAGLIGIAVADRPPYRSSIQLDERVHRSDAQEAAAMRKLARISLTQAQKLARKAAPRGHLTKIELENEDGNVVYTAEFSEGNWEREVVVDAGTGKILMNKLDKD